MAQKQPDNRKSWMNWLDGWKQMPAVRVLLFLVLAAVFYFSLSTHLLSKTYDIQVGTILDKPILAPRQLLDEEATNEAKKRAVEQVEPAYTTVQVQNIEFIGNLFDKLEQINADDQFTSEEKADIYKNHFASEFEFFLINESLKKNEGLYSERLLEEMEKQIRGQQYRIPEEAFFKFSRLTPEELAQMEPVAKQIVARIMAESVVNAEQARAKVPELVNSSNLSQSNTRELVLEIARFAIVPNKFYDETATLEAKRLAEESVEPVYIDKNDVIAKQGTRVSEELYERLQAFGLLKENADYWPKAGLAILVTLFVFVLYLFCRQSHAPIRNNNAQLLMLALIILLNLAGMKIVALAQHVDFPSIAYLAPVAMGSMLITMLLELPLAYVTAVLFSIMSSIIFNVEHPEMLFDFRYGLVSAVVCFVAIFSLQKATQRSTILKAGMMVSLFASLALVSIKLLNQDYGLSSLMISLAFTIFSGLLTAILVIGLLPFFEVAFGILSSVKLVELSNPNHPLLRKLLTETPGTYHHSVMVGNLAETAAESIGANGLLCRVGSFYHDIGKTKRPQYFIENQANRENPHDHIDPSLSKSIIIAHARDGVEMLKEYKIPKQICDIAEQHHGTTLLKYFYHKALKRREENPEGTEEVREEDYRYPGPKAQTKEAAIVGISDCVEAAVRSLKKPTMEQIDLMVDKIIKDRLDDNQFNECDLTLKELDTISKTLKKTLLGIFHSRIEYPDLPDKKERSGGGGSASAADPEIAAGRGGKNGENHTDGQKGNAAP